jgi:ferredoxin
VRRARGTDHIEVDTRPCEACGRCVEACREDVLGLVGFWFHHHVKVEDPGRCRGCLRCVRACEHGALRALRPRRRAAPAGPSPAPGPSDG